MKRTGTRLWLILVISVFGSLSFVQAGLRGGEAESDFPTARPSNSVSDPAHDLSNSADSTTSLSAEGEELVKAKEAMKSEGSSSSERSGKIKRRAEAFIAGSDWEFDGFVAGGQDQEVKSMFVTNDLIYLNIGSDQGLKPGERLGVYRRGDRIRDPQNGRVLGFEVRKLGVGEVTDLIDPNTCSLRVLNSYESVEIGDLVRKE